MQQESQFDIYRKLTSQGNVFINTFASNNNLYEKNGIPLMFNFLSRFWYFEQKCRSCG